MQSTLKCVKRLVLGEVGALRPNIRGYHVYIIIWKPLVGNCLQCVKEPTNEVDRNSVVVVGTNSHCKGEAVGHV